MNLLASARNSKSKSNFSHLRSNKRWNVRRPDYEPLFALQDGMDYLRIRPDIESDDLFNILLADPLPGHNRNNDCLLTLLRSTV